MSFPAPDPLLDKVKAAAMAVPEVPRAAVSGVWVNAGPALFFQLVDRGEAVHLGHYLTVDNVRFRFGWSSTEPVVVAYGRAE